MGKTVVPKHIERLIKSYGEEAYQRFLDNFVNDDELVVKTPDDTAAELVEAYAKGHGSYDDEPKAEILWKQDAAPYIIFHLACSGEPYCYYRTVMNTSNGRWYMDLYKRAERVFFDDTDKQKTWNTAAQPRQGELFPE